MGSRPLHQEIINTHARSELVELTGVLRELLRRSGMVDGMIVVTVPHTTAGVMLNENADPDVRRDILQKLDQLVPQDEPFYEHDEGNSDAHLKTAMIGNSVTLLVESGRLVLGKWQGVWFCEFDGPRERRYLVKMVDFSGSG
jgi:secondary thiamine-phosphate synthase enzyme